MNFLTLNCLLYRLIVCLFCFMSFDCFSRLPLVRSSPVAFDMLLPGGSFFNLLFRDAAFPPNFMLPITTLPVSTNYDESYFLL